MIDKNTCVRISNLIYELAINVEPGVGIDEKSQILINKLKEVTGVDYQVNIDKWCQWYLEQDLEVDQRSFIQRTLDIYKVKVISSKISKSP